MIWLRFALRVRRRCGRTRHIAGLRLRACSNSRPAATRGRSCFRPGRPTESDVGHHTGGEAVPRQHHSLQLCFYSTRGPTGSLLVVNMQRDRHAENVPKEQHQRSVEVDIDLSPRHIPKHVCVGEIGTYHAIPNCGL